MTRTEFVQKMVGMGATREQIKSALQRRRSEIGLFDDEIDNNDLGSVSSKYESGNDPSIISSGEGDIGGKSYGSFQLSTETGTLKDFLNTSGYANQFQGTIGSPNFDKKWKELSQDEEFNSKQKEYIVNTHYKPVENYLRSKYGLDISQSKAVKELVYSTANQFGAGNAKKVLDEALAGKTELDEKSFIDSVTDIKLDTDRWFESSPIETRQSVKNRFAKEREDLYGLITPQTEQVTEQPTEQVVSRGESAQSGDSFLNKLGQSATSSLAGVGSAIAAAPGLTTDAILALSNNINKAINFFTNKTFNKKFLAENMKAPEWAYDVAGKAKEKISTDNETVNSLLDSFSSKNLKDIQQTTSQSSKMTEEGKGVVGSLWSKLKKGEIKDAAEYLTYATVENGVQNILASVISAYTARPELGLAILAGTSATDKMREYVENGNQTDDRTMQVLNSINTGLMEYAGERMGTYEILKPLRNKFFKTASEVGVDKAKKLITKPIVETIKNIAKNTGKEVSSEVFTQLGQNLGDIIAGDKEMTLKEAFSGAADAGLLAITSSGPMTTLGSISETKQDIRQQKLQAVDEQGNPVNTMTDPAQQLIDEQGEVDESPYIESFKMTEEDLLSRYEYDKEGRNLLKSAVTTDPKIDEETRTRLLSEMDSIDNITEEIDNEEESQETETLLNEQEPTVEPQSSQEATTPIPTTETSPNADLPSVETATTDVPVSTITTTEGAVQTPQNPATKEEEQVSNPVTSPSYITKRDDGTVVVDKRNIQDEILTSVFKTNKNNELSIEDVKNTLVEEYSKTFNNKLDAVDQIIKIESVENLLKEMGDEVEYINKEQFLDGLKSFGYSAKQTQVITELVNNLKVDKLPKITNEKLLGKRVKNNFYGFSKNILSAETPDALMHEVGHFAFYNVLDSNERINYMKYMVDKFVGTDKNIDSDLATKNIQLDENTKVDTNTNKDFDEYFAEQFRQYVIENKVTDPQFKTLFSRLKEYLDAVLKAFRKTGYNKDLVKYFDKIIDGKNDNTTTPSTTNKSIFYAARREDYTSLRSGVEYYSKNKKVAEQYVEGGKFGISGAKVKTYSGEGLKIYDPRIDLEPIENIIGKKNLKYIESDGLLSFESYEYDIKEINKRLKDKGYDAIAISEGDNGESIAVLPNNTSKIKQITVNDSEKTNIELSKDQKKFISRLDIPEDKLSVAKEIVSNIDFSVPYQNKSEAAKLGPKFKRLIRIIANDPEFSIELNGEEVTLKDAIKGKTRKQMAEIADRAALGTELEAQGAGSTMKKQERRQFVESITNGMEYTPKLEQQIKKEFAGNKDFNFDKIFEIQTGEISRKEQNRVYKEAIAKGYSGDKLTKYMTDELNKLPGKKVLLVRNPEKFAQLKGEDAQSVDAKDIDIIYDKDVIDDKIKANVTEVKKKRKPPKQLTAKQKAETYVADKIKLRLTDRNVKIRFYDFVNKHLYGVGADSYRRQIFALIEKVKAVDDVNYKKAMELVDEAIDYKKSHQAFVRVRAFKMKHKKLLKKSDPDYKKIATELESLEADYKKFVDYTTMKRLNDRGEVLKPKKEDKAGNLISTKPGERYNSLLKQKFAEIITKDGEEYYTLTDLGKKTFPQYKKDLTTVDGMFDAQRINSSIIAIKEEFKAVNKKVRSIKKENKTETEIAVEDIGKQVSAKKRTLKQIKSATFWNYSKNAFWRWVGSPRSLTNINFKYKAEEMDGYRDDGLFQKYITNPMAENRRKVYENKNKIDDGLKEDIKKSGLSYKDIRRMSDQLSVGTVERLTAGDRKKRKRKVQFDNGEVEMSEAREVSLYLLAQGERGYNHLVNGGFSIETDDGNNKPFVLTDNDILSIGKRLNDRQKKLVKVIKSHFERQSEIGNEVSLSDIGEKIFNEPNYFPILVQKDYLASDKQVVQTPEDLRQTFFKGLPSITKARQDSKQPIMLEDPFIAIARTSSLFNQYMDMVMVTNKAWNIINNDKFRTMMIKNGYEAEFRAMYDDVKDMMTVKVKDSSEQALKIINSVFTVAVLGYKPTVVLSQPIATVLYAPEMDIGWREFAKASLDVRNWFSKSTIKEKFGFKKHIEKLSPYLKERFNSSMEVVRRGTQNRATAAQMFLGGKKLKRDHLKLVLSSRGSMSWTQDMDSISIMGMWKLLEVEAVAKGYKRGTTEFDNYVARRTEYITQMTQQTFDSFDSPPLTRSTLGRLVTRFLSQSLKSGMMLRKQMYKLGDGELSVKDRTKAGLNALGIIISQSVAVEALKVSIKAVGGGFEDDEWMTAEYWAKSLATNILTLFGAPGIILGGILGGYGNVGGGNFGALTERIGEAKKKIVRALEKGDGELGGIAIYELAKTFLPIGGPEQLYKFSVGLWEMIFGGR